MQHPFSEKPLLISIKQGKHRDFGEEIDEEYVDARMDSLQKYSFRCQKCGFVTIPDRVAGNASLEASGFLEVHHVDDNHENNADDNLVPLCPFCHMIFHISFAGHNNMFSVIFCPSISQEDLNILCNCLFVALHRQKKEKKEDFNEQSAMIYSNAGTILTKIRSYQEDAIKIYGDIVEDPKKFGISVFQLYKKHPEIYKQREKIFNGLRIVPNERKFEKQIDYWSNYCWLNSKKWYKNWEQIFRQFHNNRKKKKG